MRERIVEFAERPDELERQLSRLTPRNSGVDRDRLMFLAGREGALREQSADRRWSWPMATAASWLVTAAVAGLWTLSVDGPEQVPVAQNAPMQDKAAAPSHQKPLSSPGPAAAVTKNDPPAEADSWRRDDARAPRPHRREPMPAIDALLDGDDLPRLSMVGWQSWDRSRRSLDEPQPSAVFSEPVDAPPASYSQLMKVYLDNAAVPDIQGDLL